MRQVIKSSIERGIEKERTLMINFEDSRVEEGDWRIIEEFFEVYKRNLNPKEIPFVFLDEAHGIKNWKRWVRTMQELRKARIVITGSSSSLIEKEISDRLTGRHLDVVVFPLSFIEFLRFKGIEVRDKLDIIENLEKIKRLLKEYLEFGGFPEVVLSNSRRKSF